MEEDRLVDRELDSEAEVVTVTQVLEHTLAPSLSGDASIGIKCLITVNIMSRLTPCLTFSNVHTETVEYGFLVSDLTFRMDRLRTILSR